MGHQELGGLEDQEDLHHQHPLQPGYQEFLQAEEAVKTSNWFLEDTSAPRGKEANVSSIGLILMMLFQLK